MEYVRVEEDHLRSHSFGQDPLLLPILLLPFEHLLKECSKKDRYNDTSRFIEKSSY
jgi:hypothetical protein